jgi:hypothetical protein
MSIFVKKTKQTYGRDFASIAVQRQTILGFHYDFMTLKIRKVTIKWWTKVKTNGFDRDFNCNSPEKAVALPVVTAW